MNPKIKKKLFTLLKITITVALLYFVITKIPISKVIEVLKRANLIYLGLAIFSFVASQWISAERLALILNNVEFNIKRKLNYSLYLLGMFYNFFIPGGVGGDAYKVYCLNKKFNWPAKKLSAALIFDRFSGLTAIGILCIVFALFIPFFNNKLYFALLILALLFGVFSSLFVTKKVFKSFYISYFKSLVYSVIIQLLQCLCIFYTLKALHINQNEIEYLLVFLISSVLSILSFAGIGVREAIFYQASEMLNFNATTAVSVGMLFSIFTAIISFFGILFHFKKVK